MNSLLLQEHSSPDAFFQAGMDLKTTMGSASGSNAFLEEWKRNKGTFEAVGLNFTDAEKMFRASKLSGHTDEEAGASITKASRGFDRLLNLNTDEKMLDEYHELRKLTPDQDTVYKMYKEAHLSPAKLFSHLKRMGRGSHALDAQFGDYFSGKSNTQDFAKAVTKIYPTLSQADKVALGDKTGSRAISADLEIGDYSNVPLLTAGADSLHGDTSQAQASAALTARETLRQTVQMPASPADAMRAYIASRGATLAAKGANYDWRSGPSASVFKHTPSFPNPDNAEDKKEIEQMYGSASWIIHLARKREAAKAAGAPADVLKKYDDALKATGDLFQPKGDASGWHPEPAPSGLDALVNGQIRMTDDGPTYSRSDQLQKIDEIGEAQWIAQTINQASAHKIWKSELLNPDEMRKMSGAGMDAENADTQWRAAQRKSRPAATQPSSPATQPSQPSSINYHIRQVNYGMSYDQLGAPESTFNRLG